MSYLRAEEILPQALIEEIQQYVSRKSIYFPSTGKQDWGSRTETKQALLMRNREILRQHQSGISIGQLAKIHYLSEKSIQRIIREMRFYED